jgi:NTP pyrophosphatase (non-canonical NTP hydrolase)
MKKLIQDNYDSIVARGLITPSTKPIHFLSKLNEEVNELINECYNMKSDEVKEEMADVILTVLNFAKHFNIDIESELNKKIDINFKRAVNHSSQ